MSDEERNFRPDLPEAPETANLAQGRRWIKYPLIRPKVRLALPGLVAWARR